MVEPTHFKNMLVKLEIFPNFRGEFFEIIWNHQLEFFRIRPPNMSLFQNHVGTLATFRFVNQIAI